MLGSRAGYTHEFDFTFENGDIRQERLNSRRQTLGLESFLTFGSGGGSDEELLKHGRFHSKTIDTDPQEEREVDERFSTLGWEIFIQ